MLSEQQESSCEDRLNYLFLNLVGQVVSVYIADGSVLEGLFLAVDENKENLLMSKTRRCTSLLHSCDDTAQVMDKVVLKMDSIIMMDAVEANFRGAGPARGINDPLRNPQQAMTRWADYDEDDEGANEMLEGDNRGRKGGADGWDQFGENKRRFGVKTTYNENLYTTELKENEFTQAQKDHAARLAREIEGSAAHGGIQHRIERGEEVEGEEGDLYSDVHGNRRSVQDKPAAAPLKKPGAGAYVPPSKRQPGSNTGAPVAVGDMDDRAQRMSGSQPANRTDPSDAAGPAALGGGEPQGPAAAGSAAPSSSTKFNPGAREWKPPAEDGPNVIENMVASIAAALQESGLAKSCSPDWPGDDLFYDEEPGPDMSGGNRYGQNVGPGQFGGPMGGPQGGFQQNHMGAPNMGPQGGMGGPNFGGPQQGNFNQQQGGYGGGHHQQHHQGGGFPSHQGGPGGNMQGGHHGNMGGGDRNFGPQGGQQGNFQGGNYGGQGGNFGGQGGNQNYNHGGGYGQGNMDRGGPRGGDFNNNMPMRGGMPPQGGHFDPNQGQGGGYNQGPVPGRGGGSVQGRGAGRGMGGQPPQPLPPQGGMGGGPSAPSAIDGGAGQGGDGGRGGGVVRGRGSGAIGGRGLGGGDGGRGGGVPPGGPVDGRGGKRK